MKRGKLRRDLQKIMVERLGDQLDKFYWEEIHSTVVAKIVRGRRRRWYVHIHIMNAAHHNTWVSKVEVISALVTELQLKHVACEDVLAHIPSYYYISACTKVSSCTRGLVAHSMTLTYL